MGTGALIVCGRKVKTPEEVGRDLGGTRTVHGWYKPFSYSPEYVMYVKGEPLGEVYPLADLVTWMGRLYPHNAREYDSQDEAMLFLEAVSALAQ